MEHGGSAAVLSALRKNMMCTYQTKEENGGEYEDFTQIKYPLPMSPSVV